MHTEDEDGVRLGERHRSPKTASFCSFLNRKGGIQHVPGHACVCAAEILKVRMCHIVSDNNFPLFEPLFPAATCSPSQRASNTDGCCQNSHRPNQKQLFSR